MSGNAKNTGVVGIRSSLVNHHASPLKDRFSNMSSSKKSRESRDFSNEKHSPLITNSALGTRRQDKSVEK